MKRERSRKQGGSVSNKRKGTFPSLEQLRLAVQNEQLVLYYQPQLDSQTLRLVNVEALVRWQHPQLGLLRPAHFMPIAETDQAGLMHEIGRWVLSHACRQVQLWQRHFRFSLRVAVNISACELEQPGFIAEVENILSESGLEPSCLELELTETLPVRKLKRAATAIAELRANGIRIAHDDFGTGYCDLNRLYQLPGDVLKIDQSFIRALTPANSSQNDYIRLKSMVGLAHCLGLATVAEGVEIVEQQTFLQALGCDLLQGYLYSPPLPVPDLETKWFTTTAATDSITIDQSINS
jgi:EAL domain-containing protein (putative c-di-GMP-specific phosphodiesterase class I)